MGQTVSFTEIEDYGLELEVVIVQVSYIVESLGLDGIEAFKFQILLLKFGAFLREHHDAGPVALVKVCGEMVFQLFGIELPAL